jgi:transcriptional regulator with XRE-family HTH domain
MPISPANFVCGIPLDFRYDESFSMQQDMPDRNMSVKNKYSPQRLAPQARDGHNMPMNRIKEIREAKGWTQADLSSASGINQGYLSKMENGTANATMDKIKLVSAALGVDDYELFAPSDLKSRVLLAMDFMEPAERQAALVVIEAMAGKPRP